MTARLSQQDTLVAAIATLLCVLASDAQVRITSFSRSGRLEWRNEAGSGLPATYRVDWSSSPSGPWNTLTNTYQTFTFTTNAQPADAAQTFYRVVWTNGQVWAYEGYGSQGLLATGKLHVLVAPSLGCIIAGGSWYLEPAPGSDAGYPRVGWGSLAAGYDAELDCSHLIQFGPRAFDDAFWIDVLNRGTNTWTGAWYWENFGGTDQGTFVARKLLPGQ